MKKYFLGLILTLMTISILGLSIRGIAGNPSALNLSSPEWKENGPFELSPERGRFALTYSLIEDKSFYFSVPLARFIMPDLGYSNGKFVSLFAPGVSYLIMSGYFVGKYFGSAQVGSFAMIALFAFANAILIYEVASLLRANKVASLIAAGLFLFGSPAYAYGVNLYQHHISTFLIVASLFIVLKYKSFWSLTLVWLLSGFSIPVDYPNLVLMIPICIYATTNFWHFHKNTSSLEVTVDLKKITSVISVVVPLAFFLWFNNASYGNPLQFSGTVESVEKIDDAGNSVPLDGPSLEKTESKSTVEKTEKTIAGFFQPRKMVNGLYILLFSSDRGLLTYSPILLIMGVLGMFVLSQKHATKVAIILGVIVANITLYTMWSDPWGGWAFGPRYLIPTCAMLSIFTAFAISKWKNSVLFLAIVFLVGSYSLYVNTAGALSSSANPPKVQILELEKITGREEKYSFDRNIDFLKFNTSKSFFYQVWAKNHVSSWQYFHIVAGILIGIFGVGVVSIYFTKKADAA